jgi:hypothetical protein
MQVVSWDCVARLERSPRGAPGHWHSPFIKDTGISPANMSKTRYFLEKAESDSLGGEGFRPRLYAHQRDALDWPFVRSAGVVVAKYTKFSS